MCEACVLWGQQSARTPLRSPVCPCPVFPGRLGLLLHLTFPFHSSSATSHPRRASLGGSQGLWVQNVCALVLPVTVRHTDQWRPPSPAQGLWLPGSAVSWHHSLPEHWSLHLWGGENARCPLRVGGRMQGAKTFACLPGMSRDGLVGTQGSRQHTANSLITHTDLQCPSLRMIEWEKELRID